MFLQKGGIINGFLLSGIGIQIAANRLHVVDNLTRASVVRSLKGKMLTEMGHTAFVRQFIAGAGLDGYTAIDHIGDGRDGHHTHATRQCGGEYIGC